MDKKHAVSVAVEFTEPVRNYDAAQALLEIIQAGVAALGDDTVRRSMGLVTCTIDGARAA